MATATPAANKPETAGRTWLRRGVITVLVLGAIGLFVLAGTLAETDSTENAAITDGVVEALTPLEDSSVVQQSRVTLDLTSGWTGNLTVNGVPIPEEETLRNPALNLVEYQPLDDQVIEQLQAGRNCANAVVWPIAEGPEGASQRNVAWCWEVV